MVVLGSIILLYPDGISQGCDTQRPGSYTPSYLGVSPSEYPKKRGNARTRYFLNARKIDYQVPTWYYSTILIIMLDFSEFFILLVGKRCLQQLTANNNGMIQYHFFEPPGDNCCIR